MIFDIITITGDPQSTDKVIQQQELLHCCANNDEEACRMIVPPPSAKVYSIVDTFFTFSRCSMRLGPHMIIWSTCALCSVCILYATQFSSALFISLLVHFFNYCYCDISSNVLNLEPVFFKAFNIPFVNLDRLLFYQSCNNVDCVWFGNHYSITNN